MTYLIHTTIKIYLEIPPEIGKKVGIHFYENIPSEIDLPLFDSMCYATISFVNYVGRYPVWQPPWPRRRVAAVLAAVPLVMELLVNLMRRGHHLIMRLRWQGIRHHALKVVATPIIATPNRDVIIRLAELNLGTQCAFGVFNLD